MATRDKHKHTTSTNTPPPVTRGRGRAIFLVAAGVVLFSVLVLVVFNIDTRTDRRSTDPLDEEVIELLAPRGLTADDLQRSADDLRGNIQAELSQGGVVEIADPRTQQLVQRYRFASLDPNPEGEAPGWLRMRQPRFEIFLDNDRVVTIEGESALAYRPHRAIESGTITQNVIVRLYEPAPGREVDFESDEPSWVVTTDEASLDNFLGEIRCDDWVQIQSRSMTLPGRQLRLLVDDQSNRIELRIAEPEYIRIVSGSAIDPLALDYPSTQPRAPRPSSTTAFAHSPQRAILPVSYTTTNSKAERAPHFYLLTLTDDVIVKQGDLETRRIASGDLLQVIFSTQTTGFDSARDTPQAQTPPPLHHAACGPMPLPEMIATLAIAGLDETLPESTRSGNSPAIDHDDADEQLLGPNITLIRSSGPLTIVPLDDSTRHLDSPEHARLELTGSPALLHDLANDSQARGRMLAYETGAELIELIGTAEHPLLVSSPDLDAGGEHFFHSAAANAGGFIGAGWMTHRSHSASDDVTAAPADTEPDTELHITWQRGMELKFDDSSTDHRGGKLKSAFFDGDVRVITHQFNLDADQMTVGFADDAQSEELNAANIRYIHAVNSVRVIGVADTQSIKCEDLHLDLTRTASGNTIPLLLVATGDVEAIDEAQMIWSDLLRVSFVEGADDKAQVDQLLAEREVQVLLSDGTRAFGDKLLGDGVSETVELLGEDVTIISDKMVMDRGKRLILNRSQGTAHSPGPGSLRIFNTPVLEENRQRIDRPVMDAARQPDLSARWSQSMLFDSTAAEGAGSVDFRGNVDVLSMPTPLEKNTMTGQSLTLVFEKVDQPRSRDAAAKADTLDERGKRQVRTFIARQNAKIESHTYTTPQRDGEPKVFYIAGDYIEHDTITNEALVAGAGQLLIHDITPPDSDPQPQATTAGPFGSRGTTMMNWTRELRLTRAVDNVFDIVTRGDVVLRHQDLDGAISWVTAERLHAIVTRRESTDTVSTEGLDIGGSAELQRVRGTGGVVIRTDQRTVNCDSFDYDINSGIARLVADPGRIVSIETQGSPNAVSAGEAIWDMQLDSIRIVRAAGLSGS